jgi:hypothetical protein
VPVSGGLYNFLTLSPAAAAVQALLSPLPPIDGVKQFPVYLSRADKQPPANYIVIHGDTTPAAHSQDGPSGLQDGEFQFDSYAPDQLTAQQLSNAVKSATESLSTALSDGTVIQFYKITMDADEPYEQGGGGYVFRRVLKQRAFYTEPGN